MTVVSKRLSLATKGGGDCIDVTEQVRQELQASGVKNGTATVFITGTTASVAILEWEQGILEDFRALWERLAPQDRPYQHNIRQGDDNAHSHARAGVLGQSLVVPVVDGALTLGTWQRIVAVDFDTRRRTREIVLQFMGE